MIQINNIFLNTDDIKSIQVLAMTKEGKEKTGCEYAVKFDNIHQIIIKDKTELDFMLKSLKNLLDVKTIQDFSAFYDENAK